MQDDSDESKEFEATPSRLKAARKKGDVAKLADLSSATSLAFVFLFSAIFLFFLRGHFRASLSYFWISDTWKTLEKSELIENAARLPIVWLILAMLSLLLVTGPVGALLPPAIVQSLVFSMDRVTPKLSNVSPISGFKNKFGSQGFFEFLKSSVKLTLFVLMGVFFTFSIFQDLFVLVELDLDAVILGMLLIFGRFAVICIVISLLIGVVDALFQRAFHLKKLRMSRKEMQDEFKESEGDPALKSRQRQVAAERARQGGLGDVPSADVVLVNPTHYAVALAWDRSGTSVPVVVAKGVDQVAQRIRALAHENGVPVRRDPVTTRSLYNLCKIGDPIHAEHFKAVAAAIRFADALRSRSSV
jgi:flagellar biosynthetic protein FlhB